MILIPYLTSTSFVWTIEPSVSLASVHRTMPVLEAGLRGRTSILILPVMDTVGAAMAEHVIYTLDVVLLYYSFTVVTSPW